MRKNATLRRHKYDDVGVRVEWVRCNACGRRMRVAGYAIGGICSRCCIRHFARLHEFLRKENVMTQELPLAGAKRS